MKTSFPTLKSLAALAFAAAATVSVPAAAPSFSLAWSEYPSWSVFGVASELKLIDGAEGKQGPLEKKWNVDIVLKEAEYDPCLTMYGAAQCDAVCITTLDALNPSLSRPSVVILPTSTSYGADALIVPKTITDVKQLKGKKIHGLAKSVSEYCFNRNLELVGEKSTDYKFTNMDPGAAAVAFQQKQAEIEAIIVWNPFVMETLNKRKDAHVLFDSTKLPNEIIDSVVVAQSTLDKPGGKDFACAVIDTYYAINKRIADPATRDDTLVALGEKFSHLDLAAMKRVVQQTKFYSTPSEAVSLLTGTEIKSLTAKVTDFCVKQEITASAPKVGYGAKSDAPGVNLRLDPSYIKLVQTKQ
nr:urea carboxylase-related ABC transporter periplasmic substrate-binding protein [uncultured bacterium]